MNSLPHTHPPGGNLRAERSPKRVRWMFGAFFAIAALLLAFEHRLHLLGILPWLFLLACPLMHLFMHHGHGGDSGHHHDPNRDGEK